MHPLAFLLLILYAATMLPGSSFKQKPRSEDMNWRGPHIYLNIAAFLTAIALAIATLAS